MFFLNNERIFFKLFMKLKTTKETEFIFKSIYSLYPNIKTELNYSTPFQFLIAVMLSAQTTDKQVNIATKWLFKLVKTPEDLIRIDLQNIENHIKSLNYFKTKSKSILNTASKLITDFNSNIPNDLELIQTLPWVGIKTAKVVLGVLYDAPYIGVDTHIHRVCNRIWICSTKTPELTDQFLEKHIYTDLKKKIHHALVLFGRYNCIAKAPKCTNCPINQNCNYFKTNLSKVIE